MRINVAKRDHTLRCEVQFVDLLTSCNPPIDLESLLADLLVNYWLSRSTDSDKGDSQDAA